jgi:hypothetical protein
MNSCQLLHGLELDHKQFIDEQVQPVAALHGHSSIHQRHRLLPRHVQPAIAQTRRVARLEQPRSKSPMRADRSADNVGSYISRIHSERSECSVVKKSVEIWRAPGKPAMARSAFFMPAQGAS